MMSDPDLSRYIDVHMRGGAAVSDTEATVRQAGRVLIYESPCPVLMGRQRAALSGLAEAVARKAGIAAAATLHFRASPDWTFEFTGASEPSFCREGEESVMLTALYGGPKGGRLTRFDSPAEGLRADGTHVKTELSVAQGSDLGPDAFMGHIITRGDDRGEALRAMKYALDGFVIEGVATNIPLLSAILSEDRFERGVINANYVKEEFPQPFTGITLGKGHCRHIAAVCAFMTNRAGGPLRYAVTAYEHAFTAELTPQGDMMLAAVDEDSDKATVEVELKSDWQPGDRVIKIFIDDRLMILQVKPISGGFAIYYRGANLDVLLSPQK